MQKVVYSISKVNKDEKLKGVGYLVEGNLLIPSTSSKGNAYIRVFEDVTEKCKAVANSDNEFKGYVTVAYENIHVFNKEKNHYDTLDYVETTYASFSHEYAKSIFNLLSMQGWELPCESKLSFVLSILKTSGL